MNQVSFGAGNSVNADRLVGKTFGEIVSAVGPILGNGDNVEAFLGGIAYPASAEYTGGAISLVTKACSKA